MIPKFRFFDTEENKMHVVDSLYTFKSFGGKDITIATEDIDVSEWRSYSDGVLMQSTGLKDKNGVEIFEGDMLKGPMDFGPAGFVESVAPVSYHKINGYKLHYFLLEHTEVIGNVYEDKNIKFGIVKE